MNWRVPWAVLAALVLILAAAGTAVAVNVGLLERPPKGAVGDLGTQHPATATTPTAPTAEPRTVSANASSGPRPVGPTVGSDSRTAPPEVTDPGEGDARRSPTGTTHATTPTTGPVSQPTTQADEHRNDGNQGGNDKNQDDDHASDGSSGSGSGPDD